AMSLMDAFGWQTALVSFGVGMLLVLPLSLALATAPAESSHGAASQSLRQALSEAVGNRSYVLLVLGFFTCGFQLAFITVHMPAYLIDRGLSAEVGGWTIAVIGLFNIFGSLASGWLGSFMPKRYILSFIYFARAAAVLAFISFPVTAVSSILFGAVMGLLWLSTVAPTNGIIALVFGTRWLATLAGLAFFSHQVGGFLRVVLRGLLFLATGSSRPALGLSGPVRRAVGGDHPADRGKTGGGRGRRAGLTTDGPGMDERTAQRGDDGEADSIRLSSGVRPPASWRSPAVILACGCLIAMIGF